MVGERRFKKWRVAFKKCREMETKKPVKKSLQAWSFVVPPGIEPGTHGFSVRCSTN